MKKVIRIVGKQITENSNELEKGYVEVEFEVEDLLGEIGVEDVTDYALNNLRLINPEDFEYDIDHFEDYELVRELKNNGYNFSKEIDEDECIDFLEDSGYTVTYGERLDLIDDLKLVEIIELFNSSSWIDREVMYKSVCS